jgi:hypothetical protein
MNGGAEVHYKLADKAVEFVHIKNGNLRYSTHFNFSPFSKSVFISSSVLCGPSIGKEIEEAAANGRLRGGFADE